jgi:RNA polymerase sigma factor, sigma-70 family
MGVAGVNQEKDLSLIERIRTYSDPIAKEELVDKYLPMIHHIVRIQNPFMRDYEDYLQEGAIGLLKAIEEYDPVHYQIKFSTFAYICILRRIYNTIKHSLTKKALFSARTLSLNAYLGDDDSRTIMDSIADTSEPFTLVEDEWVYRQIDSVCKVYLSPVEYLVVNLIIQDYSLNDIQRQLSLSPKVVDNARTRARLKLKKVLLCYGSFLNPNIPLKIRKRNDLAMQLEVS